MAVSVRATAVIGLPAPIRPMVPVPPMSNPGWATWSGRIAHHSGRSLRE